MKKLLALVFLLLFVPLFVFSASAAPPSGMGGKDELDLENEQMQMDEGAKKAKEELKPIPPIKMVLVKGGCFEMGDSTGDGDDDERPTHEVCVGDYYMSETEVTQELFDAVMGYNPSWPRDPQYPAVLISWYGAVNFIRKLNERTKGFYRLPTEAEWEYAARSGGKKEKWPGVDNQGALGEYVWYTDNSDGSIQKVKQKKPNALGLYDMGGNVWEWVEDYFDFDYYQSSPKKDPYGPDMSFWRVLRGGACLDEPFKIRATYRHALEPVRRTPYIGFRLAE